MELKKFTRLSMLLAISIVLGIVESVIPLINGTIPGCKLGIANCVVLAVLYCYGWKEACYLSLTRVILLGILRTGLFSTTFFFSIGGACLSIISMGILHRTRCFTMYGVSVIGSVAHTIGQIGVAIFLLSSDAFLSYLPFLVLLSIPTGIVVGYLGEQFRNYLEKRL